MKLEAKIRFSIKNIFKKNKFTRLDFSNLNKNLDWKIKKLIKGDCVFILPEEDCYIYGLNPGLLSYHDNNYSYISPDGAFSLIKKGYMAARKVLDGKTSEFDNEIGIIFCGESVEKLSPRLVSRIKDVGEKLFSEYELQKIDESKDCLHMTLKPKLKELALSDYFKNT